MEKLAAFAQLNPNPAMELTADGAVTYFNDAALKLAASVGHEHPRGMLPPDMQAKSCSAAWARARALHAGNPVSRAARCPGRFTRCCASQVVHCYVEDITERLNLEAQLRQSQKMESIGQLAAGVAHDFNNMLTIIQGHAGMLLAKPDLPPELLDSAQAIYFAAERAASLTRQLLMFSRKNVMQPKPARPARGRRRNMTQDAPAPARRDHHAANSSPPPELPLVQADAGMIEQVIMNLAVNARDAMPKGGTLTISTERRRDRRRLSSRRHPEARPGPFVCLRVADTGCGMDAATLARIFEPFFTTKEVGKGTGLGLATVYGIVKQHEGWIEVASEVGKGTTFSVFFPASAEPVEAKPATGRSRRRRCAAAQETILVVEDEPVLRDMAQLILEDCGYHVLEAGSGAKPSRSGSSIRTDIDLLLTDMVMPEGISGMDLAEQLLATKPELKIIFASGYSMDDLDTAFLRKGRAAFLQKPYTHVTLAKAVRDCLDKYRCSSPRLLGRARGGETGSNRRVGHLNGEFVHFLLLGALNFEVIRSTALVVEALDRLPLTGGEHEVVPKCIQNLAGLFERSGAFLYAQFKDIAPRAARKSSLP